MVVHLAWCPRYDARIRIGLVWGRKGLQGSEIATLSVGIGATIWFAVFPPRTILMRLILGIFAIAFLIYGLTTITLEYVAMKVSLWPIVIIGGVVGCIAAGLAWKQSIKHPAQAERPKLTDEVTTLPEIPSPQATRQPEKAQPETKQTPHPSKTSPSPAQSKQKDVDTGLTFREVPPESLGFKRTVPDSFTIEFGTNKGTFPTELLERKVPFESLIGIKADGDLPLKVYFDKDGDMKIDATIYESRGKVAAVIKSSNFAVINSGWDRNWDPVAFEIVDERQNPIFQIERINWNFLKLRGLLITSEGAVFAITDSALIINPTGQVAPPKRLFQYPGNAHLHQRVGK